MLHLWLLPPQSGVHRVAGVGEAGAQPSQLFPLSSAEHQIHLPLAGGQGRFTAISQHLKFKSHCWSETPSAGLGDWERVWDRRGSTAAVT